MPTLLSCTQNPKKPSETTCRTENNDVLSLVSCVLYQWSLPINLIPNPMLALAVSFPGDAFLLFSFLFHSDKQTGCLHIYMCSCGYVFDRTVRVSSIDLNLNQRVRSHQSLAVGNCEIK